MAKGKKAAGKLAGKTVVFVGKIGYRDYWRSQYEAHVVREGGIVVGPEHAAPDYVVAGEGRAGKPPGDIARIQKKTPTVTVLDLNDLVRLVAPDMEQLLREIAKGRRDDFDRFWDDFEQLCRQGGIQVDLRAVDLRKADLFGAHLQGVDLAGADLRGANVEYTRFGALDGVNFDDVVGKCAYLQDMTKCTFRRADLERLWMFSGDSKIVVGCDFTGAKMTAARLERGTVTNCKFINVDLSDAELERSLFERVDFSKSNLTRLHASDAKFVDAVFVKANLHRADLRRASLVGADLRHANLREAVLSGADLSGANVEGADFQDAVLTDVKLDKLDVSKAKNLKAPIVRVAGPKLRELSSAAAGAKKFTTWAEVDLGTGEFALLDLEVRGTHLSARSRYRRQGNEAFDWLPAPTFEQGLINMADRWPNATLRLDSVDAKGSKTLRGAKLRELAIAAWAEVFGVVLARPDQLKVQRDEQEAAALRERDDLMKKIRKKGSAVWNNLDFRLRDRLNLQGMDLSGAVLPEIQLWGRDMKGANFAGANLNVAELWSAQLQDTIFTGANLECGQLQASTLNGANFRAANLTSADLSSAKLLGADFTDAVLTDANLDKAHFDHTTLFPAGFKPPASMIWKGDGLRPGTKKAKAAKAGSMDFASFLEQINKKVEQERMQKAGAMLKAERFQLFAEVKPDSLVGIVKSQSSEERVYTCRLGSDGAFGCCTQNLRPCGGLRGALCKHLLVLIVGLAKAEQVDAATVDNWINLSRSQKPAIDEDAMSATFLRYQGAEAGEVDWRPTETIPEDYYAM